jgi:hypothetical protein
MMHGRRIQESTGAMSKTVAKEYEKRRGAELERAAGMPADEKAPRLRSVTGAAGVYLERLQAESPAQEHHIR